MKHQPYIFRHAFGTLTIFAKDKRSAIKKANLTANGFHVIPEFNAKETRV